MKVLYLILLFSLAIGNAAAQLSPNSTLEQLLRQAFHANINAERVILNHIGIEAVEVSNGYLVTAVLENYPAHAVDIRRGDIIEMADGNPFHPIESFNSERDTNGNFLPKREEHILVLSRANDSMELSVIPVFENLYNSYRSATANSVLQFSAGNKTIGYIRFWALSRATADIINYRALLRELSGTDGIIFDFRNSLGFLDPQHLDLVFPTRDNYFTSSLGNNSYTQFAENSPTSETTPYRKPIAVLLNRDTRGGTELFAYQLKKLQRVITLGEATRGEIGEYLFEDLSNGEEFYIDDQPFRDSAIIPEQLVPFPYENTERGDPQFDAAINALLGII